jgi:RNA polymerase sigma-70 factor, ECF subfamily
MSSASDSTAPAPELPNLDDVVRNEYPHVYRFCYSLCANEGEAQDATQHAFLQLVKASASIKDWDRVRSWLFTVAKRAVMESHKKQRKMDQFSVVHDHEEAAALDTGAGDRADGISAVAALQKLEPNMREALSLFYLQQYSYEQIAAHTEAPLGTVMSRLHRGKQRLRVLMGIPQFQ